MNYSWKRSAIIGLNVIYWPHHSTAPPKSDQFNQHNCKSDWCSSEIKVIRQIKWRKEIKKLWNKNKSNLLPGTLFVVCCECDWFNWNEIEYEYLIHRITCTHVPYTAYWNTHRHMPTYDLAYLKFISERRVSVQFNFNLKEIECCAHFVCRSDETVKKRKK